MTAEALRERLGDERAEIALVDVREQGRYALEHILLSVSLPLSRIELRARTLLPRQDVALVLVDADGSHIGLAEQRLRGLGYTNLHHLDGGITAWREHGCKLVAGTNVVSKAFGEAVAESYQLRQIGPAGVASLTGADESVVVLDSRPPEEFREMNVPGAVNCAGAELAYRVDVAASGPDSMVIVNCAGRTRSILGAQSLINAGVPYQVAALENGTLGWELAGLRLEHGSSEHVAVPDIESTSLGERARKVRRRFGVDVIDSERLREFLDETTRTTYLLDVRTKEEFYAGHVHGSRHAPGGQVVQALDEYVGVWRSRVVLIDSAPGIRAAMTASWLDQIGLTANHVLIADSSSLTESGPPSEPAAPEHTVTCGPKALADEQAAGRVEVLDLADSITYERGHIAEARFVERADLVAQIRQSARPVVLTSPDGLLATWAARDASAEGLEVAVLAGGTQAWRQAALPLENGRTSLDEPDDVWRAPWQVRDDPEGAARAYFDWELGLVEDVEHDGLHTFRIPRPAPPRPIAQTAAVTSTPSELVDASERVGRDASVDAADRDRVRAAPLDQLNAIRAAGIGAIRVPQDLGGPGGSIRDLIKTMIALSAGDPSLGQALQPHFVVIERLRLMATAEQQRNHLGSVLEGTIFGNATSELGTAKVGDINTRLARDGHRLFVTGEKFYSTGSLIADEILVLALDENDDPVYALLPRHRPGLEVIDDWDGFGQRATGSGTTRLHEVPALPTDLIDLKPWIEERHYSGSVSQLLHAAIDVGIAQAAATDAVQRAKVSRPVRESGVASAAQDPYVLRSVGRVEHLARRARAMTLAAADELDVAESTFLDPNASFATRDESMVRAALETAHAKIAANDACLEAASAMFEVGGASAAREIHGLDRHWRNARTHTLHDPIAYRYRALGDYLLNDVPPPISFVY